MTQPRLIARLYPQPTTTMPEEIRPAIPVTPAPVTFTEEKPLPRALQWSLLALKVLTIILSYSFILPQLQPILPVLWFAYLTLAFQAISAAKDLLYQLCDLLDDGQANRSVK